MKDPIYTPKKSSLAQTALFFIGGAVLGGILTTGFFLNKESKKSVSTTEIVGESLFKVDGNLYSSNNLPNDMAMSYYQLESSIYDAKTNFVNQTAVRIALAKDGNQEANGELPSIDKLISASTPSDTEVKEYYDSIVARYGQSVFGGQTYENIKPQLAQQLSRQKRDQSVQAKIEELTQSGRIQSLLTKPEAPAVQLNLTNYPVRGKEDSSITLVEISDYMCPHCRETEPVVEEIYKEFKDKVKFVQITFPLNPQGLNGALARGAFCASEQGHDQFWKYHENAFHVSWGKLKAPNGTANPQDYFNHEAAEVAKLSNLDLDKFNSCLVSDAANQYITNLQKEFTAEKGFQGTPTFYLNNKLIQANPSQLEATLRNSLKQIASK